jgi:hypothetical protein
MEQDREQEGRIASIALSIADEIAKLVVTEMEAYHLPNAVEDPLTRLRLLLRSFLAGGSDRSFMEAKAAAQELRNAALDSAQRVETSVFTMVDRLWRLFFEGKTARAIDRKSTELLQMSKGRLAARSGLIGGIAAACGAAGSAFIIGGFSGAAVTATVVAASAISGTVAGGIKSLLDRWRHK